MVRFITLEMNQITHHFTEFAIRINEDNLASQSALIRLRQFQLRHKITMPIWSLDYQVLSRLNYHDNLSASILYRMSSLDVNFQYCRDISDWSIPGQSPEITTFLLDAPDFPPTVLRSFWSSNHHTYRLGQCTHDSGPLPWSIVKAYQGLPKQGRTPIWFIWISAILRHLPPVQTELHTCRNRLPSTDRRRKEWVSFTSASDKLLTGRISSKSKNARLFAVTH